MYKNGDLRLEDFLKTIPIVSSMNVLISKANELKLGVKVPRVGARNPDNEPDAFEINVLEIIYDNYKNKRSNESLYYSVIDEKGTSDVSDDSLRYFKGITLSKDCLKCHGDPNTDGALWVRDDGKDIVGYKMDNKKEGDLHGAFELKMSMMPVYNEIASNQNMILFISIALMLLLSIVGYTIGVLISRPLKELGDITVEFANGNMDARTEYESKDEIGVLAKDISQMQDDIKATIHKNSELVNFQTNEAKKVLEMIQRLENGEIEFEKHNVIYSDDTKEIGEITQGIHDALYNLGNSFVHIIQGIEFMIGATKKGELDQRADSSKFKGAGKVVIEGMNDLMKQLEEPIVDSELVLQELSSGNLNAKILKEYEGKFNDLKNNINALSDSLISSFSEIDNAVISTSNTASELTALAEDMSSASLEQSAQTHDVAAAVEEMSATISDNNRGTQSTTTIAQKNMEIAETGGNKVTETIQKMKDIAEVVSSSAKSVEQLGNASKEIGEIIQVIEEIADQTNLLALNAAIEAARAGEQGRGFAVVADEVRKLAERTTEATTQIANMIKDIQSQTGEAVHAMEKGNSEVELGIAMADDAGLSLKQILDSSSDVLTQINHMANASAQQTEASNEISRNMQGMSEVINSTSQQIHEVSGSAEKLYQMTADLKGIVEKFSYKESSSNDNLLQGNRRMLE